MAIKQRATIKYPAIIVRYQENGQLYWVLAKDSKTDVSGSTEPYMRMASVRKSILFTQKFFTAIADTVRIYVREADGFVYETEISRLGSK